MIPFQVLKLQVVGPRDTTSPNKDALGGNLMYTIRTELRVPIPGVAPQLGINGAIFGIAGAVSDIDENWRRENKR